MKKIMSHFSKRQFFISVALIMIVAGGLYYASGSGATHAEVPANTAIPVVVQTLTEQINNTQQFIICYDETMPVGFAAFSKPDEGVFKLQKL